MKKKVNTKWNVHLSLPLNHTFVGYFCLLFVFYSPRIVASGPLHSRVFFLFYRAINSQFIFSRNEVTFLELSQSHYAEQIYTLVHNNQTTPTEESQAMKQIGQSGQNSGITVSGSIS